jgi:uncharacterized protein YlxW (UPF0749 family)
MENNKRVPYVFTIICLIIGFMIAIQFQTNKNPELRDTRDLNQLRIGLQKERERSQTLLNEISKVDQLLFQYETSTNKEDHVTDVMLKELNRIKKLSGYADMDGEGFLVTIKEIQQETDHDSYFNPVIYDADLRMIVNELSAYGAKAISINDQRVVATTAIRNVGNGIQVNTIPIRPPYYIKVIGDSSILIPALKLAGLDEYFMLVNHVINYEQKEVITVSGYKHGGHPEYLQPIKEAK